MANGPSEAHGDGGSAPGSTIVLVGFMAAGKTSVGRALARRTGWPLLDVDAEVEARTGLSIARIFESRGEAWFRELEARVAAEAMDRKGAVVVPGGGWAVQDENRMARLPPHVTTVWLRVSPETAVERAGDQPGQRPLMSGVGEAEASARELLARREPYYARAHLHLDTEGRSPVELAEAVLEHLRRNTDPAKRES